VSTLYTLTGKLGGPFIIHPDDTIRAMSVFPNQIIAAVFIDASKQDSITPTHIPANSFVEWLDHLSQNGITHLSVCPRSPEDYRLVPIDAARLGTAEK
jgi:hypothetical protein